jgi:hypothetical protein
MYGGSGILHRMNQVLVTTIVLVSLLIVLCLVLWAVKSKLEFSWKDLKLKIDTTYKSVNGVGANEPTLRDETKIIKANVDDLSGRLYNVEKSVGLVEAGQTAFLQQWSSWMNGTVALDQKQKERMENLERLVNVLTVSVTDHRFAIEHPTETNSQ